MPDNYNATADKFNRDLGDVLGSYALAMIKADVQAKRANIAMATELLGGDGTDKTRPPNIELDALVTVLGQKQALETKISVPPIVLLPTQQLGIANACATLDMTVTDHAESSFSLQNQTEASGEGGGSILGFQVKVGIKTSLSVSKEQKRSSDYTASTHAELSMTPQPVGEGLAKIVDALVDDVKTGIEINKQIALAQAQAAAQESGAIPAAGGGGGGGGGGG